MLLRANAMCFHLAGSNWKRNQEPVRLTRLHEFENKPTGFWQTSPFTLLETTNG